MSPGVLSCQDVTRSFASGSTTLNVLRGASLTVEAGEIVAILGVSGSGKSTLLRLLAGLDRPDSGEIRWGDFRIDQHRPQDLTRRRAASIGLVFQQHYLLQDLDATENVALPGLIRNEGDRDRARMLLTQVGLADRADHLPHQLSGGERQRVAVARALYDQPPVILADEPTGSLDRQNAGVVFRLLVELSRGTGTAVLLVTHDEGLVQDVDRRYLLSDGVLQVQP